MNNFPYICCNFSRDRIPAKIASINLGSVYCSSLFIDLINPQQAFRPAVKVTFRKLTKIGSEEIFFTHFVQKCLEIHKNEQNVVLNKSSEALGNCSEIVRILMPAMTTAGDGASRSYFVRESCCLLHII